MGRSGFLKKINVCTHHSMPEVVGCEAFVYLSKEYWDVFEPGVLSHSMSWFFIVSWERSDCFVNSICIV